MMKYALLIVFSAACLPAQAQMRQGLRIGLTADQFPVTPATFRQDDPVDYRFGRYFGPALLGTIGGSMAGAITGLVMIRIHEGEMLTIEDWDTFDAVAYLSGFYLGAVAGGIAGAALVGTDKTKIVLYSLLGHLIVAATVTGAVFALREHGGQYPILAYAVTLPVITMVIASRVDRAYAKRKAAVQLNLSVIPGPQQRGVGLSLRF